MATVPKLKPCDCPLYCTYCGRMRSRDDVGHYCRTPNCQWQHGYAGCLLREQNSVRRTTRRTKKGAKK